MIRYAIALSVGVALTFASAANAKPVKHKPHRHHAAAHHAPVQPKDPYADYWNDPSRQGFPSWGLTGN